MRTARPHRASANPNECVLWTVEWFISVTVTVTSLPNGRYVLYPASDMEMGIPTGVTCPDVIHPTVYIGGSQRGGGGRGGLGGLDEVQAGSGLDPGWVWTGSGLGLDWVPFGPLDLGQAVLEPLRALEGAEGVGFLTVCPPVAIPEPLNKR